MLSKTEEILLYLYDCLDAGFSYQAKKRLFILGDFSHARKKFSQEQIKESVRDLSKLKFIEKKVDYDGSVIISLSERGKLWALNVSFKNFKDRQEKWDGRWRMIAFDIPENCRKGRDALRYRFRAGGFYELQKSLFLYPYDCEKEVRTIVKLFKLEKYVRLALLESIDNQDYIKMIFGLN